MTIEELNYCLKYFYTSERKQDGTCCETASPKSIRSTIDRFLHLVRVCKHKLREVSHFTGC